MQLIDYSIVGFIALLIHMVLNQDIFRKRQKTKVQGAYKRFMVSIGAYYIVDTLWGCLAHFQSTFALYLDSVVYYLVGAIALVFWCQYIIAYLNIKDFFGKFLNLVAILFIVCCVTILAANHFQHVFFWVDEQGTFHTYAIRYVVLYAQIALFVVTSTETLFAGLKLPRILRRRHITISIFGFIMTLAVLLQAFNPLLPIYTLGFLLGSCLLHVFVQEDEKDEIRNRLQESNQVISASGNGIWKFTFDKSGAVLGLMGNEKWKDIFGINKDMTPEETYHYYSSRLTEQSKNDILEDYEIMREGAIKKRTFQWNHPTKGLIYLGAGGTRFVESDGTVSISGFIRDVTEETLAQKALDKSLEEAKKQADAANKAKSTFLFNMSHDIRTPMNAITGFADLLEKNLDNREKCSDYVTKIQSASKLLLDLINNVLELARIESGNTTLNYAPYNVNAFVNDIRNIFDEQMKQKNIDFQISVNVQHGDILCDNLKVHEIFLNLLSNAYKYTNPGGKVYMTIEEKPSKKEGFCTYVSKVTDTGIGMSQEFLPSLFTEFAREHTSTDNKIEGSGLGMAIVKKYVDMVDGNIQVESAPDKGSTFIITADFEIAKNSMGDKAQDFAENVVDFTGKRILLVEDNDLNAEIAMEILRGYHFEVDRAEDGIQSLVLLGCKPAYYYDLILMDIQMPNMNGYRATEAIRQMSDVRKANVPIIAMTANAFDEDRERALESGMNDHVAKPIDKKLLIKALTKALSTPTK